MKKKPIKLLGTLSASSFNTPKYIKNQINNGNQ